MVSMDGGATVSPLSVRKGKVVVFNVTLRGESRGSTPAVRRRAVPGVARRLHGVPAPELAVFVGAKRSELAALGSSALTGPLRWVVAEVTRVASSRPLGTG